MPSQQVTTCVLFFTGKQHASVLKQLICKMSEIKKIKKRGNFRKRRHSSNSSDESDDDNVRYIRMQNWAITPEKGAISSVI